MTVASMAMSEFRVGAVLTRALSILGRNIVPFGLLALLFTAPSYSAGILFDPQAGLIDEKMIKSLQYGNEAAIDRLVWFGSVIVAVTLGGLVLMMLATATMVYGTFQDLRGSPAGFSACLRNGFRSFWPVLGVALLSTLLMMLGALALLIPAFIIMVMLWVAIPATVVERPGVIESLKRSMALTKGYRWRIFGLMVVMSLLSSMATSSVQAPFVISMVSAGQTSMASSTFLVANGLGLVVTAFFTALGAVASAVAYHDLRAVKEGFDIDRFAAVFD